MKRSSLIPVVFALALGAAGGATGCGATKQGPKMAKVQVGKLPAGASFKGVWFNRVWGELHLLTENNRAEGKWESKTNGVWGQLSGKIDGDVIRFKWEEHKVGGIGPGSSRKGHGYFKYKPAKGENELPKLKGRWGFGESEVGGGEWDCIKQRNREPHLDKIGPQGADSSVDTNWE